MALRVTLHNSFERPELRAAWERLSAASPRASLFSTCEWCRAWAVTVGHSADVAILLFEDKEGNVVGLLPACLERRGPVRWLKFLGREGVSGDHLDLLCAPADQHACLDALVAYLDQSGRYPGLVLGELERTSLTLERVRAWARAHAYRVHEREQRVVPCVDLPNSFDAYLASLSANMRYHIRRRRRELERLPGAAIGLRRDVAEVEPALADLFALHERRWRSAGHPGVFQSPRKRQFLVQFCRAACARGWTRCYVLECDNVRQGVLLVFHWGATASYYQMGWHPQSPIRSPGVVLLAESIAQAIREGIPTYDLLRGAEDYKWKWTTRFIEQTTLVVGRNLPARAAMAVERAKDRCRHLVRRTLGHRAWETVTRCLKGPVP